MGVLESLQQQMAPVAERIHQARVTFAAHMLPAVVRRYQILAGREEAVGIRLRSDLHDGPPLPWWESHWQEEVHAGRTLYGPHRDDLELTLGGEPLRQVASQGQIKSLLIAMKLAPAQMMDGPVAPYLLLDDIFEKLDADRVQALYRIIREGPFSQVFLTDADSARSRGLLEGWGLDFDDWRAPAPGNELSS